MRYRSPDRFAVELDALVVQRQVTLTWLSRRLHELGTPVSVSTLSSWRSGRRHPEGLSSELAVQGLERILTVSPGMLISLIGNTRRIREGLPPDHTMLVHGAASASVLRELGLAEDLGLAERTASTTVWLSARGGIVAVDYRWVLQVMRAGADRWPVYLEHTEPQSRPPTYAAVLGCTLGRRAVRPDIKMTLAEVIVEGEHAVGDTVVVEVRVEGIQGRQVDSFFETHIHRPMREALLVVHFDPATLPRTVTTYLEGADTSHRREIPPDVTVHHVAASPDPGRLGIAWTW